MDISTTSFLNIRDQEGNAHSFWVIHHKDRGEAIELLGLIPNMLPFAMCKQRSSNCTQALRTAGGWRPFSGSKILNPPGVRRLFNVGETSPREPLRIQYPGDLPYTAIASTKIGDDEVHVFKYGRVMVFTPSAGTFEVCRMD